MNPNEVVQNKINELMFNNVNKYRYEAEADPKINTLLESSELKRKLSLTSIIVADLTQDIAIVSPQYIVINPKAIERFLKPEGLTKDDEKKVVMKLNVEFTNFISDLLKQSMDKSPNDTQNTAKLLSHENFINLVAQTNKKMADKMDKNSFNEKQFEAAKIYFETGNNIEKIPKFKAISSPKYISKLLKDETYLAIMNKDIKNFCKLYEETKDKEIRDDLLKGIAVKIVGKTKDSREYLTVKAWENLANIVGVNPSDCPSLAYATRNGGELKKEISRKIAAFANEILNTTQTGIMLHGITNFSKVQYMFDIEILERKVEYDKKYGPPIKRKF